MAKRINNRLLIFILVFAMGIVIAIGSAQKLIFADAETTIISCDKFNGSYDIAYLENREKKSILVDEKTARELFNKAQDDEAKKIAIDKCGLGEATGSEEALKFYLWNRDIHKKGIPFSDSKHIKNITPLNQDFYKKEDILKHFLENKGPNQIGAAVIIKTEHCFKNQSRPCSTATAAFEKESTPLVSRFKLYGHMVPPDSKRNQRERWEQDLIDRYGFVQGPGATIVFLVPGCGEWKSDASRLNLLQKPFLDNFGKTPELHKYLEGLIQYWERRAARQKK